MSVYRRVLSATGSPVAGGLHLMVRADPHHLPVEEGNIVEEGEMTIERHSVDGFTIYAIRGGYLVHERYIGYTVKEGKRLFISKYGREGE